MPAELRAQVGRKRSQEARLAILGAALTLLREKTYAEVSCDSIASAAGVGKQTIYRWWKHKADVVLDALSEHARAVSAPETGSLEGDLRAFFESTVRLLRGPHGTGPVLKGLMAEAQLDATFAPRFGAFIDTRRSALRRVLVRHSQAAPAQIDVLVDMLFGALWYRLLLGHAPLDRAFAAQLAQLAAHGLE